MNAPLPYSERSAWFHEARFGMFIHYGLYSLLGRGEWVQWQERIPAEDYAKLAHEIHPAEDCVDQWLDLALDAGMKYAVLTTKHLEGFCLFNSSLGDFTLPAVANGRDLVREFVDGCRARNLKVGLYYCNADLRFPGYFEPERYPESREDLVHTLHHHTRELLTNYGPIDMLWFDGCFVDLGGKNDVADPAAFWRSQELLEEIYRLQPHILVNNRLGIDADLDTPEQHVTASEPGRCWESCMTIGDEEAWGWCPHAANRKSVPELLKNLMTAAGGEGNYLLNIGPRPDGSVEVYDEVPLLQMGEWLRAHGEAVYGSQRFFPGYTRHWQGGYTRKGNTVYITLYRYSTEVPVPLLRPLPVKASLLHNGQPLLIREGFNQGFVIEGLPEYPPVEPYPVIKLEFDAPPDRIEVEDEAAWIENALNRRASVGNEVSFPAEACGFTPYLSPHPSNGYTPSLF